MDVLNLQFEDNYFDAIIDKSTLDAILCGNLSFYNAAIMMWETQRVLSNNGSYICISYGVPKNRMLHFKRDHLDFKISCYVLSSNYYKIENDENHVSKHYCYVMEKNNDKSKEVLKKNYEEILVKLYKEEMEESNCENTLNLSCSN